MHLIYDWEEFFATATADRENASVLTCFIFAPSTPYSNTLEDRSTAESLEKVLRFAAIVAEANRINRGAKRNLAFNIIKILLTKLISKKPEKSIIFLGVNKANLRLARLLIMLRILHYE